MPGTGCFGLGMAGKGGRTGDGEKIGKGLDKRGIY